MASCLVYWLSVSFVRLSLTLVGTARNLSLKDIAQSETESWKSNQLYFVLYSEQKIQGSRKKQSAVLCALLTANESGSRKKQSVVLCAPLTAKESGSRNRQSAVLCAPLTANESGSRKSSQLCFVLNSQLYFVLHSQHKKQSEQVDIEINSYKMCECVQIVSTIM